MEIVKVDHLTRDYGHHHGIFNLNLVLNEGEIFGLLGPNGAGKTTLIRHLMGFLKAEQGKCRVFGLDCMKEANQIQKRVGYLPAEIAFFNDMTGNEFIKFMAAYRHLKDLTYANELIDYFELDAHGKIKQMSKGMKQKVGLVTTFMHHPDLYILDEPTSGLDPLMQNKFVELLLKEKEKGKTILLSSHSFEEIEKTCDRVGILKQGELIKVEDVNTLRWHKRKVFRVTFEKLQEREMFVKCCPFKITKVDGLIVELSLTHQMKAFIDYSAQFNIVDLDVVAQTLEEIFLQYYGGSQDE